MLIRLQKLLADAGCGSRRKCEEFIKDGRVSVDGIIVTEMGVQADPLVNAVTLDGQLVLPVEERVYIALNKPVGYISSANDQFGRPTVLDLTGGIGTRIFPVGRLDYDTSGLIFLTNDGSFAYKLTHPKHNIDKTYIVDIDGEASESAINALREGVVLEDGLTMPAIVSLAGKSSSLSITITEGRNRQVRRMLEAVGHKVLRLQRVSIGGIELGKLAEGKYRHLQNEEIQELLR